MTPYSPRFPAADAYSVVIIIAPKDEDPEHENVEYDHYDNVSRSPVEKRALEGGIDPRIILFGWISITFIQFDDTPDFTGLGFVVARSARTWDAMIPAKDETDAQRLAPDLKAQHGDQLTYCEIVPCKQ